MATMIGGGRDLYADVPRQTRFQTVAGFAAMAVFVLGFGIWADTARIASAVITNGQFVATGENKIIQDLNGGVIREILVHEGDVVAPGQVLMRLDDTAPKAELARLVSRQMRDEAMEARLAAEIRDQPQIVIPPDLVVKRDDADVQSMIQEQQLTFEAWRKSLDANVAALQDGISAIKQQADALVMQKQTTERQLELVNEEEKTKKALLTQGLVRRTEVLAVESAQAGLEGQIGKLVGDIGDANAQIAKTQQQIIGARSQAATSAVEQLHETEAEIFDLRERIRAQQNVLDQVDIAAPVRGVVVKLRYHTSGGVIEPGKNIMEIVPLQDKLIIEVMVQPRDIFHVKVGQQASVLLSALNRRTTPIISGKVIYVSADALPNDADAVYGKEIYIVRVALDTKQPVAIRDFKAVPGMPAEVYINTGQRTFFEYLTQPIKDSMSRAFRES
jgi:HlyD family type I secretion membrane fusion protein